MPTPTHLRPFDLAIVALYLIGITLFGLRFREKKGSGSAATPPPDRSLKSYFLANNTIPWWAIALSIVSAETSTLTIISVPGVAFGGDFGFLQIVLGYMLGRIVVALLFLPRYFAGEMLTAYQLIDQRFGPVLHKVTAGLFLLTRAAAEGVRVFAVSIVVGIAIGTGDTLSIAIISLLTLLYTFEGGMAAVIWTDVVQMAIYVLGTLVAVWSLGHHVPGGWHLIYTAGMENHKFHLFNFALNLTTTYTFWAGILGGTFLTMASHGTDQLMVQRLLAARNLRQSQAALLSSGIVIFMQFFLFLLIGVGLWVFYAPASVWDVMTPLPSPDRLFPTFIVQQMPPGVSGLLIAAILAAAMSNLSAALNSMASTSVIDFFIRLKPNASDRERSFAAKASTVFWALILFDIALYSLKVGGKGHVVEIGLSIASVAYGCLLGVFLLGTLTKFATEIGATLGMICGFALNLWLWQGTFPKVLVRGGALIPNIVHPDGTIEVPKSIIPTLTIPHIAFTWYVLIGALVTFAIGALASLIFRKQSKRTITIALTAIALFCLSSPKGICVSPLQAQQTAEATLRYPEPSASTLIAGTLRYPEASASGLIARAEVGALAPRFAFLSAATELQPSPDFTPITTLLNDAIANHHLPGAVVVIGHNNHIVFEQAYGNRKLAGEPGLTGQPTEAEPMTEDTIFDMASLTKCLATATAVMQLYEQGKITSFDDPLVKYLPEFAASNTASLASAASPASGTSAGGAPLYQRGATPHETPQTESQRAGGPTYNPATFDRSKVTLRMLLTHTSGEAPDISLADPWGLAAPDRTEGLHRALTTPLKAAPGSIFTYSDINFILLGDLVETLSGQAEDVYVETQIFRPLGMSATGYHSWYKACAWLSKKIGSAIEYQEPSPHPPQPCHAPAGQGCGIFTSLSQGCSGSPSAWSPAANSRTAPTAHDNEGTDATNPDFDHLLRGTVHDPTTRRMGGVAGHAGVFSTAHDISLYAAALLQKLRDNTGPFPLKQSTLQLMTQPEQPSTTGSTAFNSDLFTASQLRAANQAQAYAIADGTKPAAPGLAPAYPAMKGVNLRGFGWDIDTAFSKPRGAIFPIGSFGHTGFTGTSLWMNPASDTYVILLANAIHPRGGAPISNLRGQVATAAALALGLDHLTPPMSTKVPDPLIRRKSDNDQPPHDARYAELRGGSHYFDPVPTLTGIDVLESTNFAALACTKSSQLANSQLTAGNQPPSSTLDPSPLTPLQTPPSSTCHKNLGLLTNQTGIDSQGRRTIDVLITNHYSLTTIFTPEHGLSGSLDREGIASSTDAATHLPVISLYGKPADRRPTHEMLKDLDAILVDLQDAGVHFWTYEAATGYFLEAAALEKSQYHHDLELIILDRPNPIGGIATQGPISDPGTESYVNYMPLPVRHGLTLGELMQYANATKLSSDQAKIGYPDPSGSGLISTSKESGRGFSPGPAHLIVIPMQHWQRTKYFADTGLPWTNPSPNLRSPEAAILYPALGLIETTNLSVGRGTGHPFSFFGVGSAPSKSSTSTATGGLADPPAKIGYPDPSGSGLMGSQKSKGVSTPWFNATTVAAALTARHIPGVTFTPTTESIAEDTNHYPYHGQTIEAVRVTLTDPKQADTPEIGIEILSILHQLYPTQFHLSQAMRLVCNQATMEAIERGTDPRSIAATWAAPLAAFRAATMPYLLYH